MANLLPALLLGALSLASVAPVAAQQQTAAVVSFTFGTYSFKKPTDVYNDFAPAIESLENALESRLNLPVTIDLKVYKTYEECLDKFVAGEVDFVRFGPASYVIARERNPEVQLLVAEQEDGKKRCQGVIAVRKDSPVQSLADLKGRTFAFGDQLSTIGRFLSQAKLVEAGITEKDLKSHEYLERHDKVFKAVELGNFDAGAMHIATFEDNNTEGSLRTICVFENVGKPWIARAGLDERFVTALRESLLTLETPAALKALKVHGFLPATDGDYQLVRDGMKTAERFSQPHATPDKD
ncbi:MAG: hypothetical protein RIT25_2078 [Planctomycetota bacterium]